MESISIEEALKKHTDDLLNISGVVGTAQGLYNDKPCIKVFVLKKTPDLLLKIPENINGFDVMVEETGEFKAYKKSRNLL